MAAVLVVEKSSSAALNDVTSLRGWATVASRCGVRLHSSASLALSPIRSATAALRHARHTISIKSKELRAIAQLKVSIKFMENNVWSYKVKRRKYKE